MADARGREERALTISVVIVSTVVIPEQRRRQDKVRGPEGHLWNYTLSAASKSVYEFVTDTVKYFNIDNINGCEFSH